MKFKHPFVALAGLAAIAVGAPLLLPHIGFGSSAGRLTAPTNQTQNVNVVNTPTVGAQQSGTWNVGIDGTPVVGLDAGNNTVKVDPAVPVSIRDVDNPARQPFRVESSFGFLAGATTASSSVLATVPVGKRLVIEYVSLRGDMFIGQRMISASVSANNNGTPFSCFLPSNFQGSDGVRDLYLASQQVRFYADPGASVTAYAVRDNTTGSSPTAVVIGISGYFVDVP